MQLKRKKKKEREALGDKVSFLSVFVLRSVSKVPIIIQFSGPISGATKRSAKDDRKPEGLWRDNGGPSRRRGTEGVTLLKQHLLLLVFMSHFVPLPVPNRLLLMRQPMSFLPTFTGWQTQKSSSQHQTGQEEWVCMFLSVGHVRMAPKSCLNQPSSEYFTPSFNPVSICRFKCFVMILVCGNFIGNIHIKKLQFNLF